MVDNMEITELEPYVRNMTAPREVRGVPMGLAAAVVERIAHTRLAEFQGCSAMVLSMLVWEVFLLYDRGKVTREQALPAMRLLARVAAAMPIERFLLIDVAQITINLAKVELTDAKWFARLAAGEGSGLDWQGVRRAKGLEQSITNTIYGLALVKCDTAGSFVDHLFTAAISRLTELKPQNCSNMLWALAKLQHPLDSPQLLAATGHKDAASLVGSILQHSVLPQLPRFNGQDMTNTVCALALLQLTCDNQVMAALVGRILQLMQEGDVSKQGIANCLWSFVVKLNHRLSRQQVMLLVDPLLHDAAEGPPINLANTMWALGTGAYNEAALKLQQPLHAYFEVRAADFEPQDLSNIAISLAKLGHHSLELMGSLVAAARLKLHGFQVQHISNLLWSLAVLEPITHASFFKELEPVLMSKLGGLNEQHVANIAWAHAVVLGELTSLQLALGLFRAAVKQEQQATTRGLTQLFHLMAVSSSEVQAAVAADERLRRLRVQCGKAYAGVV